MSSTPLAFHPTELLNHPKTDHMLTVYRYVWEAEQAAISKYGSEPHSITQPSRLICARVVGYFILEPFSDQARSYILQEVEFLAGHEDSHQELHEAIYGLGRKYATFLIRAFKKYKGRTPSTSTLISQPSFYAKFDDIGGLLVNMPKNHSDSKAAALIRDGHRCMVTQKYNLGSIKSIPGLRRMARGTGACRTECCHIIPESTNMNLDKEAKSDYAVTVWTILETFGAENLQVQLSGTNAHRLENILTLDHMIHDEFDTLSLWFEKLDPLNPDSHQYYVRTTLDQEVVEVVGIPEIVEFTNYSPEPGRSPLPNSEYLRIHAACAKVAHMSGAGEYFDKISRDKEKTWVLSSDGSSAAILYDALLPLGSSVTVF